MKKLVVAVFMSIVLLAGVTRGEETEFEFEKRMAETGDPHFQWSLGLSYENGDGVRKSHVQAMKWYRKAADQGDPHAEAEIAFDLIKKERDGKFSKEGLEWLRKSAKHGYDYAQYRLGEMYEEGERVTQSWTEAAKWYKMAAEQGDEWAQREIARLYGEGKGVRQSWPEAFFWLSVGDNTATDVAELRGEAGAHLTPADRQKTEARAKSWVAARIQRAEEARKREASPENQDCIRHAGFRVVPAEIANLLIQAALNERGKRDLLWVWKKLGVHPNKELLQEDILAKSSASVIDVDIDGDGTLDAIIKVSGDPHYQYLVFINDQGWHYVGEFSSLYQNTVPGVRVEPGGKAGSCLVLHETYDGFLGSGGFFGWDCWYRVRNGKIAKVLTVETDGCHEVPLPGPSPFTTTYKSSCASQTDGIVYDFIITNNDHTGNSDEKREPLALQKRQARFKWDPRRERFRFDPKGSTCTRIELQQQLDWDAGSFVRACYAGLRLIAIAGDSGRRKDLRGWLEKAVPDCREKSHLLTMLDRHGER